jgi:hypothetical protein
MTNPVADSASDYNAKIIHEFRANEGHVGGPWAGTPMLLIHHIGARSGTERVTPLAYYPRPGGRFVIVASNGGSPAHPGWYHNLKAKHQARTTRQIPVFMLTRQGRVPASP